MPSTAKRLFEARPEAIGEARSFATEALTDWGLPDLAGNVRLCVSELATNALLHGTAPGHCFLVRLDADGEVVRLEVHDSRRRRPELRQAAGTEASGRGLVLVNALADDWGVQERSPFGKIVWTRFKAPGRATV
ncbi:ATP-binding protein [Streptomyces alkaliterrae]|uniref:ATP-binding protein n=1 Tax=Streptomyces alkaliterrae TaxID=2213162 RepID=A0A5P0YXT1_9ACTN|nr:ATP-binding protein [Streptomyces alkaliterrae]MQS05081.1 ATP-binding protein [Streptomyces alkaliterrae]